MAELLVKAQDSPVSDGPGKWKQGHVVTVKPDGHLWGAKEGLPRFVIVKVPGIDVEDVEDFLAENKDELGELVRRRNFLFDRSRLTAEMRSELLQNGSITLTRTQIKAIKRAVT